MTPRAAALAELLGERSRKRVSLEEIWRLFDRVSPESRGPAQRRALLADAVAELVDAELVDAGVLAPWRSGDGGRPPLPRSVRRVEDPAVPFRRRPLFGGRLYFGDVDAAGLRIPASASALALEAGLPAVRPAVRLCTELGQPAGADGARESVVTVVSDSGGRCAYRHQLCRTRDSRAAA